MKILIASDSYRHQINGVSNSVVLLTQGLRELGHQVKVLTLSPEHKSYKEGDDYYIASLDSHVYPELRISFTMQDELIDELVAWKPDIAHIQTEFSANRLAMKVVNKCGIPYVMTSHTNYEEYIKSKKINGRLARAVIKNFERIVYGKANTLIVPSWKIQELAEIYKIKCPVVVIPNGIELRNHPLCPDGKSNLLKELGIKDNGKVLVTVSRISKEKNIDELIGFMPDLLKVDPDVTLVIVGGGPHLDKLKEKAEKLGLNDSVRFTGMIPKDEVYRYYQLGDVFVCASTFETQGLTYVEALANALPLVCREDKCLINIIEAGENGYTYTDCETFISHITEILGDREKRDRMGKKSHEKSYIFGKEVFVRSVEQLYADIVERHETGEVNLSEE